MKVKGNIWINKKETGNSYILNYEGKIIDNNKDIFESREWKINSEHKGLFVGRELSKIYSKFKDYKFECEFDWNYDFSQPDFLIRRIIDYIDYVEKTIEENVWTYEETDENWEYMKETEKRMLIFSEECKPMFEWEKTEKYNN